jgi:hypothetical protein
VDTRTGLDAVVGRKIPGPCRNSNPVHPARSLTLYHSAIQAPIQRNLRNEILNTLSDGIIPIQSTRNLAVAKLFKP